MWRPSKSRGRVTSSRPYRLGKRAEDTAATDNAPGRGWAEIELAGYRPASIDTIAAHAGVTR